MKRTKLLLSGIAVFTLVGIALAFTPKKTSQQCLYIRNAENTECVRLGKFDPGGTTVTGKLLPPNPDGTCPPPPPICNEEVDIQPQE